MKYRLTLTAWEILTLAHLVDREQHNPSTRLDLVNLELLHIKLSLTPPELPNEEELPALMQRQGG